MGTNTVNIFTKGNPLTEASIQETSLSKLQYAKNFNASPSNGSWKMWPLISQKKYPPIDPPNFGDGYIKSVLDSSLCVDATNQAFTKRVGIGKCSNTRSQKFKLSWQKDIR